MSKYPAIVALLIVMACCTVAYSGSQYGVTMHDKVTSTEAEAAAALKTAKALSKNKSMSAEKIMVLYHAEEKIGAYSSPIASQDQVRTDCNSYVKNNATHFREVADGWKGEDNYFEPNSFWADELRRVSPKSNVIREIEFDLKFKDLMRSFRHDERAVGKSCTTFYMDIVRAEPMYLEVYTKEEIDSMSPSCLAQRNEFIKRRDALLREYADLAEATKLKEIDPTEIVSDKYFGLC